MTQQPTETQPTSTEPSPMTNGWRTLAIAGAIVGLLGLLAIIFPFVTGLSIVYVIGGLLLLGGLTHGAHAVSITGWSGRFWQLSLAVVSILAGLVLLVNPILGLASLTLLLVGYLIVDGLAEIGASLRMGARPGRVWIAASGIVSILLATLLWIGFPSTAAWALGLLVGVSLFTTGLSMTMVAYAGKDLTEDVTPPVTEPRGV